MSDAGPVSRAAFEAALATEAANGLKALVVAPLGAGKTHSLRAIRGALDSAGVPVLPIDLFTAASTPERLLVILAESLGPFLPRDEALAIRDLATEGSLDRHQSSGALLRLLDLLALRGRPLPFVWVIDEATEIRSLAYFPGLHEVERPFARALANARGAVLTSSYPGLASGLFPEFTARPLPGLLDADVRAARVGRPLSGSDIASVLGWTAGHADSALRLLAHAETTRDAARSLAELLRPGALLEALARGQYDVLLMRSRGYAVCKRAAETVASAPGRRLTDLFPGIGRTPGASRQYLRWLVEVGLLCQDRKRYDFADPIVGLWASLYLGRADGPTDAEIASRVSDWVAARAAAATQPGPEGSLSAVAPPAAPDREDAPIRLRRPDRFEEFD